MHFIDWFGLGGVRRTYACVACDWLGQTGNEQGFTAGRATRGFACSGFISGSVL